MANEFWLIELADWVADEVGRHLDRRGSRQLVHRAQLEDSSQSIPANIREGYGRSQGPDRRRFLGYALASAKETEGHLRSNVARGRLPEKNYWQLQNRLVVVRKSLEKIMRDDG